jgi:hypothetical protein
MKATPMKLGPFVCAALLSTALGVSAAELRSKTEPKRLMVDLSSDAVMDAATAVAIVDEVVSAKVRKLYPAKKWAFLSQVEGGITPERICVVTARVILAPLSAGNRLVMQPEERTTVFGAIANATQDQCRQMARDKLRQAADALVSNLVKG